MHPGANRGPGPGQVQHGRERVVLRNIGIPRRVAEQGHVRAQGQAGKRPGGIATEYPAHEADAVVNHRASRQRTAHAQRPAEHALPGSRGIAAWNDFEVVFQCLEVHYVEERNVGNDRRQGRVLADLRIGDADVFDHEESCGTHHRRHELAIDRRGRFDRARLDAGVAGALHERNREDAPRHHVGNG